MDAGILKRLRGSAKPVHLATLVVGFGLLLFLGRRQWFFYDEWDFISGLTRGASLNPLAPHQRQLIALPLVAYAALYRLVALHSYLPYLCVLLALHAGLTHMLWRVMCRSTVDPWIATALCLVFLFLGVGWECLLWATNMGLSAALLLGIMMVLLVDHSGRFDRRDLAAGVAGIAAVLCVGAGLIMVAVAGAVVMVRRGVKAALITMSVPVLIYLSWVVAIGRTDSGGGRTAGLQETLGLPDYVWAGLSRTAEGATGLTAMGGLLVLGLFAWAGMRRRLIREGAAPAMLMLAAAPAAFAATAVLRGNFDLQQASSSRYLYLGVALMLPAGGLVLTELVRGRSTAARAAVLAAAGLSTIHGAGVLLLYAHNAGDLKQVSKARILAAARLAELGETVVAKLPDAGVNPQLSYATIAALRAEGALPAAGPVAEPVRLAVAVELQVSVTAHPALPSTRPVRLDQASIPGAEAVSGGCVAIDGGGGRAVLLTMLDGGSVSITPAVSGRLDVTLADRNNPTRMSPTRGFDLTAGRAAYLNVSAHDSIPLITPPRGRTILCPATLDATP